MKREKNLYNKICSFENLLLASRKAQKGKRFKTDTAVFNLNLEKELLTIQKNLREKNYIPGGYRGFFIFEPKKRLISAAPYRDRVVHHALCNIIEPLFERTFIYDSYANRKGKGTHKAIDRYQSFSRKNRYVLRCDIQKFFPAIDHAILKNEIRKKISDSDTLWLIDTIIDNSNKQEEFVAYFSGDDLFTPFMRKKGLPIGNLTSQFFANIYMNRFDHFIKEKLRCRYYIRYVDDWAVFHNDKVFLHDVQKQAEDFLEGYRLKLHRNKSKVFPVSVGKCFLGFHIFPKYKRLKRENIVRFRKKMRVFQKTYGIGKLSWCEIVQSVQSWNAHAAFADSRMLRRKLFSEYPFIRWSAHGDPCSSGRFLEQ